MTPADQGLLGLIGAGAAPATYVRAAAKPAASVLVSAPGGGADMDRLKPMAADPARRVRLLVPSGVIALAVAAGAGLYLTRNVYSLSPAFERAVATSRTTPARCGLTAAGPCPGSAASFA